MATSAAERRKELLADGYKVLEDKTSYLDSECICPMCGATAKRHAKSTRWVWSINKTVIEVLHAKYRCYKCLKFFAHPGMKEIAPRASKYHNRVIKLAQELLRPGDTSLREVSEVLQEKYGVEVPGSTIHEWKHPTPGLNMLACETA